MGGPLGERRHTIFGPLHPRMSSKPERPVRPHHQHLSTIQKTHYAPAKLLSASHNPSSKRTPPSKGKNLDGSNLVPKRCVQITLGRINGRPSTKRTCRDTFRTSAKWGPSEFLSPAPFPSFSSLGRHFQSPASHQQWLATLFLEAQEVVTFACVDITSGRSSGCWRRVNQLQTFPCL